MAFIKSVASEVAGLRPNDPYRVCLEYLDQKARGRAQAKTWTEIEAELTTHGINMSREEFQQTLLKRSRGGNIFIGSNDHGPFRGYFLIVDEEDAEIAREFYCRRIHTQQTNLDHLEDLMRREFPNHQFVNYN
jgi:hypothetical protein